MQEKNNQTEFDTVCETNNEPFEEVASNDIDVTQFKTIEVSGGATVVVPANMPKFKMKSKLQPIDKLFICAMLAIPIIMFCVFFIYLNISNIVMAFSPTADLGFGTEWFSNFKWAWDRIVNPKWGGQLSTGVLNSLILFAKDTLILPFNVVVAYFLFKKVTGYKVFQVIFYLPGIVSGLVMVNAYLTILEMIARIFESAGDIATYEAIIGAFTYKNNLAFPLMIIYSLWLGWGGSMLLLGGAMARVPVEVIESARLDGITTGREIRTMIFPLIWSTLSTLLILHLTALITNQGPILIFDPQAYTQTWTIGYWIFYHLGGAANVGGGGVSVQRDAVSAMGLIFTAIGVPVVLFLKWLIERVPVVEY